MERLEPKINIFCFECKSPTPDWTTSNKSLDLFIMESWKNMKNKYDAYIQWIEYSLLMNVQQMPWMHTYSKLEIDTRDIQKDS